MSIRFEYGYHKMDVIILVLKYDQDGRCHPVSTRCHELRVATASQPSFDLENMSGFELPSSTFVSIKRLSPEEQTIQGYTFFPHHHYRTFNMASVSLAADVAMTSATRSLRLQPLSRRSIAALANSRHTPSRQFSSTPKAALPSPTESMFKLGSTVGSVPTSYFQRPSLPANTIVKFVPQQTAWIVERMGKFSRILSPGLAVLVPVIDRIAYVKSLKESAIEIPSQSAITADNVTLELDGVLYTRVFDPYKARSVIRNLSYVLY